MTENKVTFNKKLSNAMLEIGAIEKDGKNSFHKYKYTSAAAVQGRARAVLHRHGLCIVGVTYEISPLSTVNNVIVKATMFVGDVDDPGSVARMEGIGQGSDKGDKATMKANTAALKYAISNGFLATFGEDPEADSSTDRDAAAPKTTSNPIVAIKAAKTGTALTKAVENNVKKILGASPENYEKVISAIRMKADKLGIDSKNIESVLG